MSWTKEEIEEGFAIYTKTMATLMEEILDKKPSLAVQRFVAWALMKYGEDYLENTEEDCFENTEAVGKEN